MPVIPVFKDWGWRLRSPRLAWTALWDPVLEENIWIVIKNKPLISSFAGRQKSKVMLGIVYVFVFKAMVEGTPEITKKFFQSLQLPAYFQNRTSKTF